MQISHQRTAGCIVNTDRDGHTFTSAHIIKCAHITNVCFIRLSASIDKLTKFTFSHEKPQASFSVSPSTGH